VLVSPRVIGLLLLLLVRDDVNRYSHLCCPLACLCIKSACYKQISNFDGVISDCSAVLEVDPDNVKALIRRAQAFEGVERYRFALQDVKTVLQMPYQQVGKANFDLCNGMQHRLQRTVDQLKKMNSS
jgi:stress-induced-phosphoprotein 1